MLFFQRICYMMSWIDLTTKGIYQHIHMCLHPQKSIDIDLDVRAIVTLIPVGIAKGILDFYPQINTFICKKIDEHQRTTIQFSEDSFHEAGKTASSYAGVHRSPCK